MAVKDTHEKAMRYARYVASDIEMYNKDKVERGIMKDSFFQDMKDLLDEGREQYESQVTPEILASSNYFDRAIVDVILYRKGHLDSPIWD